MGEKGCHRSLCLSFSTVSLQSPKPLRKKLSCCLHSVTAGIMDIHIASDFSMDHGPQYGLWQQDRPWALTQTSAAAWIMDTNMALGINIPPPSPSIPSSWQYGSWKSVTPPSAAQTMDLSHAHSLGQKHGLGTTASTQVVAHAMDTNMVPRGSTVSGGLLKNPRPENGPFSILDILLLHRARTIGGQSLRELQAAVYNPAAPTRQ